MPLRRPVEKGEQGRPALRLLLRACPACHGDLFYEGEYEGDNDVVCLQCGRRYAVALVRRRRMQPVLRPAR